MITYDSLKVRSALARLSGSAGSTPSDLGNFFLPSLFSNIAGFAFNGLGSIINFIQQDNVMKQEQKNLETAWSRDDSVLQRSRADAELAGYSPLAGLGASAGNTSPTQLSAPQLEMSGMSQSLVELGSLGIQATELKMQKEMQNNQIALLQSQKRGQDLQNTYDDLSLFDRLKQLATSNSISEKEFEKLKRYLLGTLPEQVEQNRHNVALEEEATRHSQAVEEETRRSNIAYEEYRNLVEQHAEEQRKFDREKTEVEDFNRVLVTNPTGTGGSITYETSRKTGFSNAPFISGVNTSKENYLTINDTTPQASINYDGTKLEFYGVYGEANLPVYSNGSVTMLMAPYNQNGSWLINVSDVKNQVIRRSFMDWQRNYGFDYWREIKKALGIKY